MLRTTLLLPRFALLMLVSGALTLGACGSSRNASQGAASKSDAKGALVPPSPYAAIANGKVDVEGGVVEVAARRAGVVSEVLRQGRRHSPQGAGTRAPEDEDMVLAVNSARAAVAQAQSQVALTQINVRIAQRELERLKKVAPRISLPSNRLTSGRFGVYRAGATGDPASERGLDAGAIAAGHLQSRSDHHPRAQWMARSSGATPILVRAPLH